MATTKKWFVLEVGGDDVEFVSEALARSGAEDKAILQPGTSFWVAEGIAVAESTTTVVLEDTVGAP